VVEEPASPVVQDRPRGRLLFGALLGSFAVIAALVASASAGAGGSGPTIDHSRQLSAERNATYAGDIELDSHGPTFSFEVCIDGVPHRWEGDKAPGRTFGFDLGELGDLDGLEADPDAECDMPDFGRGREGHRGLPGMFGAGPDFDFDFKTDFAPALEAFEVCLAEQGADADSPPDGNRTSVIIVGPDGRTVVEFGEDVGSVTVTGTDEGVEVTTEGGAAVIDIEARQRSRNEAFEACAELLPMPPATGWGHGSGGMGPGMMDGMFSDRFEEFELEIESYGVDPGAFRRDRRSRDLRELFSGVADDGGRCGGTSQSA
jgi:hypothetical protein